MGKVYFNVKDIFGNTEDSVWVKRKQDKKK